MTINLSVPEAARVLGISERTVWRRVKTGDLPIERVGRRLLVCLPDELPARASRARDGSTVAFDTAPSILDAVPGAWPYTEERLAERRAILLRQRRAAGRVIDRVAAKGTLESSSPSFGWFRRFVDELKDEHRTWDAFMDYQRRTRT
jgi:excisionase family DNA binding protein